jgi:hypothetical protein
VAVTVASTGTDYAALAAANGLTFIGGYRADLGVTGTSGTGKASWAPLPGSALSAVTPDASATNGIGSVTAGLGGKAGLLLNGATQMGQFTAPALAAPATTNWHRYWIQRQPSPGTGAVRCVFDRNADADQKVEYSSPTNLAAYGCGVAGATVLDAWQRCRVSYTGAGTSEFKWGSGSTTSGGSASNVAPNTSRRFGSLLLNQEFLLYVELTGPKANFLTWAGLVDTASRTVEWTTAIEI